MLSVFFVLTAVWAGLAVSMILPLSWNLLERGYAALALGTVAAVWLLLVSGLSVGHLSNLVVFVCSMLLAAGGTIPWLFPCYRTIVRRSARVLRTDSRRLSFWIVQFVVVLAAIALVALFSSVLFTHDGGIRAATGGVSSDWNLHLQQVSGFAYGHNFPPEFTGLVGQHLSYPFGINLFAGGLAVTGVSVVGAAKVSSWLLAVAGVGCLAALLRQLGGARTAIIGLPLFYLLGGLGFIDAITDLLRQGFHLESFFGHLPRLYTYTAEPGGLGNLQLANVTFAAIQPQRAFVFGLPMVIIVIALLATGLRSHRRGPFLAAGGIVGVLPIVHTHSLIFLGLLSVGWAAVSLYENKPPMRWALLRNWVLFGATGMVLAIPQLVWLIADTHTALGWLPGWLHGHESIWWFWLKNYGLFLVVALLGVWFLRGVVRQLLVSSIGVFLVANLVLFQPSPWDNTKILYYVSLGLVVGVAVWLARVSRFWGGKGAVLVVIMLGCMTVAGALDVFATVQLQRQTDVLFSQSQQEIARDVRAHTDPRSVFLTADNPNSEYTSLAGRRAVLSGGWYQTYGINTDARQRDITSLYQGGSNFETLRAKYQIRYLVIGPAERGLSPSVHERYFDEHFSLWRETGATKVYDLQAVLR
ncbi:hypothetical protein EXS54_03185 [Patescibacteria group bacterium]|nr:hypothetical protein [Patescibacteria group bacterium]